MRRNAKYLVIVFLIICWLIGLRLNSKLNSQINSGVPISDKSIQLNLCSQGLLWMPTPLIIGFVFVLYPSRVASWLQKNTPPINVGAGYSPYFIFIIGLILLTLIPLDGNLAKCSSVVYGLFGK